MTISGILDNLRGLSPYERDKVLERMLDWLSERIDHDELMARLQSHYDLMILCMIPGEDSERILDGYCEFYGLDGMIRYLREREEKEEADRQSSIPGHQP